MASIANILLEVTGDSDDAQRALADVSRELAIFGRETAEAEADVDTSGASAHLDELKAQLASFSAQDATADVNVRIAEAQAEITALQAELDRIDGENVTVDIDVRRGIAERIGSLVRDVEGLGRELEKAGGATSGFAEAFSTAGAGLAGFSDLLLPVIVLLGTSLVAAAAAAAASLAEALGGLLALGDAFGAALIPGIVLGIGAILRFKDTADEAGSAANGLKEAFGDFGDVFQKATAGGADAVFRGLTAALKDLSPLVKSLQPAFTRLGQAGGEAFRLLGKQFSSPAWQRFFGSMIDSLAKLTPLFARSFGALARILANIAQASMPFLIAGFRDVAKWLEGVGKSTSHIGDLRSGIGGLVDQLKAWLGLSKAVGDVFLGFLEAAAPQGKSLTEWLTKGAEAFAEWERSKAGREAIRSFFHDVLPLAKETIKGFFGIAKVILQIVQFFAPLLTAVAHFQNSIIGAISAALDWLTKLDRALAFKNWGPVLDAIGGAFSDVGHAIGDAFSAATGAVVGAAKSIATAAVAAVKDHVDQAKNAGTAIFNGVRQGFNAVRGAVVSVARSIVTAAINAVRARVDQARSVGRAIFNAVRSGFNAVRGAVVSAARSIVQGALNVLRGAINLARSIGSSIISALRGGFNAARGAVLDAINDIRSDALDALRNGISAARSAGESLVNGLASGIKAAANAVTSAVQEIYNRAKEIIEAPLHIHIDVPDVHIPTPHFASGVRSRSEGSLALVGEQGPEFAFIPRGADVFTAGETRRLLRALADGAVAPFSSSRTVAPASGGGKVTNIYNTINAPAGAQPDAESTLAQLSTKLRARGGLG